MLHIDNLNIVSILELNFLMLYLILPLLSSNLSISSKFLFNLLIQIFKITCHCFIKKNKKCIIRETAKEIIKKDKKTKSK